MNGRFVTTITAPLADHPERVKNAPRGGGGGAGDPRCSLLERGGVACSSTDRFDRESERGPAERCVQNGPGHITLGRVSGDSAAAGIFIGGGWLY